MCGIHVAISASSHSSSPEPLRHLSARGPDHLGHVFCSWQRADAAGNIAFLAFTSSVLALRGDHITKQPFVDDSDRPNRVFCWNGEAWGFHGNPVGGNDGEVIFGRLRDATTDDGVLEVLRGIEGPFAFAYFDDAQGRLYFGRDRLGRRSLLVKEDDGFVLSSVSYGPGTSWREVEADGIYVLDVDAFLSIATNESSAPLVARHDWLSGDGDDHVSPP